MSNELKRNKGFTLIELIIAIAMLAFLMTAVTAFMTSGLISYKNAKADIRVHNSAQENYDKISDAIMEAKDVYLFGYLEGDNTLYCFVRDTDQGDLNNISSVKACIGTDSKLSDFNGSTPKVAYFSSLTSTTKVYIKALVIDTAYSLSKSDYDSLAIDGATLKCHNDLTGEDVVIKQETREDGSLVTDENGNPVYSETDTERKMFVFQDENMYFMTKYAYASANNDNLKDNTSSKLSDFIYSTSFDITEQTAKAAGAGDSTTKKLTNAIAYVDSDNGAIAVDLFYSDRNMTYTTEGMVKVRNSYVLKVKETSSNSTTEEETEGGEGAGDAGAGDAGAGDAGDAGTGDAGTGDAGTNNEEGGNK